MPIRTATWGPFVLITLEGNKTAHVSTTVGEEWLGSAVSVLSTAGVDTSLHHVATREYLINCNWKVHSMPSSALVPYFKVCFFLEMNVNAWTTPLVSGSLERNLRSEILGIGMMFY